MTDERRSDQVATIALLGASGITGGLVAAELVGGGHRVVAAAPDPGRLRDRLAERHPATEGMEVRRADATDARSLDDLLADVELVIDLAAPYEDHGRAVVEAALRAGVHHLDAALEPGFVAWVHAQDHRAVRAGSVLVPAGGFPATLLDLLASAALGAVTGADEVHLATTFPSRGGLRRGAGPTTRQVLARLLARPMRVRAGNEEVDEPVAEARRLAWFPRPVGLAHAAGVPGSAHLSVPRHEAEVATVREYLALSGWRAEVLQLAGNAASRSEGARRVVSRVLAPERGAPSAEQRQGVRWACVAETRGVQGVARAWANGRDPAATTAAGLVVLAEAVVSGAAAGVRAPGELAPAGELLDRLSAGRELRWAVIRP